MAVKDCPLRTQETGNVKLIKQTFLVASAVIGVAMASGICIAAPSECKLVRIAEWPVRLEHNRLIVDGAINGRKVGIVLDTGAKRSLIAANSTSGERSFMTPDS